MPVVTVKRGKKFRVVEAATGHVAKNQAGTAVDGGGHRTREKAQAQAGAINRKQTRK